MTDPKQIAEKFNAFFVKIGPEIANSVSETSYNADSFMPVLVNVDPLEFLGIGPVLICDTIKSLECKSSMDSDGVSTKLLKKIAHEISLPLSHIVTLSLEQGIFPEKL